MNTTIIRSIIRKVRGMTKAKEKGVSKDDMAYVHLRIQEAVKTLRRMPPSGVQQKMTSWPEIVLSYWDIWGGEAIATPPKIRPTPRQIDQMDEVLTWLAWLATQHGAEHSHIV